MKAIRLNNVYYEYALIDEESVTAVNGVSLEIEEGEFVAVIGHNGSGKSTLAKLLNGLLLPSKGSVEIYGVDTAEKKTIFEVRKNVGMVFQNPDNQIIASIVEDDVAFGPENLGVPREEIEERLTWALQTVGMAEHRKSTPFKMSGGQKQRIAIAGILALKPKILVLDESTAMLDPKGRGEVMQVAKELNAQGMTVVHITHFMDEALSADRLLVMNEGKIAADGTPQQIFADYGRLKEINLSIPTATQLALLLADAGIPVGGQIMNEADLTEALCRLL